MKIDEFLYTYNCIESFKRDCILTEKNLFYSFYN